MKIHVLYSIYVIIIYMYSNRNDKLVTFKNLVTYILFRVHDPSPEGYSLTNYLQIGVLGYADDAALVSKSADLMSKRLNMVSKGSREDADMNVNADKTKAMHVEEQEDLPALTSEQIKSVEEGYKHECDFCGKKFKTSRGMKIHRATCSCQHGLTDEEFEVLRINAVFGTPPHRWFRVEWKGHPKKDSWEPERSLAKQGCEESIQEFWKNSKVCPSVEFVADPEDVWRCWKCGKGYSFETSLKSHITRNHPAQKEHSQTAEKDARNQQRKDVQASKRQFYCEGRKIENVWTFKYLGSRFRADGDQLADVAARIASATTTAGKMRAIWASATVPLKLKLRIYKTGVCSRLTYGAEAWRLTPKACAMLNGANSRMLARITRRTVHEEAAKDTQTFDVVRWIRARRMQWVGHILRIDPERLVYKALYYEHTHRIDGGLLMDHVEMFV